MFGEIVCRLKGHAGSVTWVHRGRRWTARWHCKRCSYGINFDLPSGWREGMSWEEEQALRNDDRYALRACSP
jgi:hypothetical protein